MTDTPPKAKRGRPFGTPSKKGRRISAIELLFGNQVKLARLPEPVLEHTFHEKRRWRLDAAWPELKIAAELEGAIWIEGRHTRGSGFTKDCEKYNAAALLGWRVFRFTAGMVRDGTALQTIREALA